MVIDRGNELPGRWPCPLERRKAKAMFRMISRLFDRALFAITGDSADIGEDVYDLFNDLISIR